MSHAIARLKSDKGNGMAIAQESIRNGCGMAKIEAHVVDGSEQFDVTLTATRKGWERTEAGDYRGLSNWDRQYRQLRTDKEHVDYPLFALYNAYRAIIDIPEREKLHDAEEPLGGYEGALSGQGNFRRFFAWFRDQQAYERDQQYALDNREYKDSNDAIGHLIIRFDSVAETRRIVEHTADYVKVKLL